MSSMLATRPVTPRRARDRHGPPPQPRRRCPYVLLVPAVVALAVALGYPLVRQVVLSFQEFGLAQQFGRPPEWIGLENYRDAGHRPTCGSSPSARWPSAWSTPRSRWRSASASRC